LEKLPDIGPVKAQAILDGRPYKKVEEGIFRRINDSITAD
jgi:DNA uptake protein ComE-like DNA-binding protein